MWFTSKSEPVQITVRRIRNSSVLGTPLEVVARNFQMTDAAIMQIGAQRITQDLITESNLRIVTENGTHGGACSRESTYRAFGCIVDNIASIGDSFEHAVSICGPRESVQRVEREIEARVPDWKINIPEDAEITAPTRDAAWIIELKWEFPSGFDIRDYNSYLDLNKALIVNITREFDERHGIRRKEY